MENKSKKLKNVTCMHARKPYLLQNTKHNDLQRARELYINTVMEAVKNWLKLVELPDNRLPKAAYETVKSLDDQEMKTWASDIRTCLFQYGFGIVWVSQQVENKTGFLRKLK